MKYLPIIVILVLGSMACTRVHTLSPYKWKALGGDFDSLIIRLEWLYNEYAPACSLHYAVYRLDSLSQLSEYRSDVSRSRVRYWQAKALHRAGCLDSAIFLLDEALRLNDSTEYRYDYLRMIIFKASIEENINGAEEYRIYNECLDYARSIDDKATEAMVSINMGNLLRAIGKQKKV